MLVLQAALATTNALWQAQEGGKIVATGSGGRRSRRAAAPTPLIKVAEVFFGKASNMARYSYNDEKHKERSL